MKPKISVIIPIYNIADYLKQCVDSVLCQSYSNLEIILVDDGSHDSCPIICDEYSRKDTRVSTFHKINGGLSDARNYGIKHATGDYIFFLDGDDWLTSYAIESLVKVAIEIKSDIVQGAFYYAYSTYLLLDYAKNQTHGQLLKLSRDEAMEELIRNRAIKNFAWGKLIRTNIVKKCPFIKGVYFEDSYWMYQLIHFANKYVISPVPVCFYRQRNESISGRFSIKNLDLLKGIEERTIFIKKMYPKLTEVAFNFFWEISFRFYYMALSLNKDLLYAYQTYWQYISFHYKQEFYLARKKSLYTSILFLLQRHTFVLLPAFLLGERIYCKFIPTSLVKIKYDKIKNQ